MSVREAPKLALAWTDGLKTKRYGTKQAAYYAIAKRMVVEKYPPQLGDIYEGWRGSRAGLEGWTDALVEKRTEKMLALFHAQAPATHFDDRRWRKFITRVAHFLAFVDSKRSATELLELRFGADKDPKRLQAEYESAERSVDVWAHRAKELRDYIDARSRR